MKIFLKKLKSCNKALVIMYFLIFIGYIVSLGFLTYSLLTLTGIETGIRIVAIVIFYLLWIVYGISSLMLLFQKKNKRFIIYSIFMAILIPIFSFGSYYINITYNKIHGMTNTKVVYTSNLIALKETELNDESIIGMISDEDDVEGFILAKKLIDKEKIDYELTFYDDYLEMIQAMYDGEIDAVFVSSNYVVLFSGVDGFEKIEEETKVLHEYSEEMDNQDILTASGRELTEPFTILLLGVDSTKDGLNANQAFNGDTLMLITFNPNTLNATVFSIPRDTYVPIACRNGNYNKINSSAAYGTSCVINTIEDFTGIDIDYYVKINFKGVVDLVDALGGVDVDVHLNFCEQDSNRQKGENEICLNAGEQKLNGEQALAYARHRKSYAQADIMRVQVQQKIVEAIAKKAKTIRSFDDFQNILSAVQKNIETNMSTDRILSFYNVGKDILTNKLTGEDDFITIEKSYLEYYSLPVFLTGTGRKTSAIGAWTDSLNEITDNMKVNLELQERKMITSFSFTSGEEYEQRAVGKGKSTGTKLELLPNFVGKDKSYINNWGSNNGIPINYQEVSSGTHYNPNKANGTIVGQSVHEGVLVKNVNSITIYVNKVTASNNNSSSNNESNNETNQNESNDPLDDLLPNNNETTGSIESETNNNENNGG